jgi:hypothetical protein
MYKLSSQLYNKEKSVFDNALQEITKAGGDKFEHFNN